jgi:hypothetical protein
MNSDQAQYQSQTGIVEEDKAPYARPMLVNMGSAEAMTEGGDPFFANDATAFTDGS